MVVQSGYISIFKNYLKNNNIFKVIINYNLWRRLYTKTVIVQILFNKKNYNLKIKNVFKFLFLIVYNTLKF